MSEYPEIRVRGIEPADIAAVTEVFNQPKAYWGTLQLPLTAVAERERRFANRPANLKQLVAEIEGKVIGCLGLFRDENIRRNHVGGFGMAVHDGFAGRGAGTALVSGALELADRWWNLKRLELWVYADNARAIALYERLGFEREGLSRAYAFRDGEYVDTLSMARIRL